MIILSELIIMATEMENNDNITNVPSPTDELKFTERMRKATRKEHSISDALINAKMTIGNIYIMFYIII